MQCMHGSNGHIPVKRAKRMHPFCVCQRCGARKFCTEGVAECQSSYVLRYLKKKENDVRLQLGDAWTTEGLMTIMSEGTRIGRILQDVNLTSK